MNNFFNGAFFSGGFFDTIVAAVQQVLIEIRSFTQSRRI